VNKLKGNQMTVFKYWMATELEVIDFVAEHLLKQGKKSLLSEYKCMYRGVGDLMCAAGCLIPRHLYNTGMEHKSWTELCEDFGLPTEHKTLIFKMQCIHDNEYVEEWPNSLAKLREQYV
jgi:hypothetical protein